MKPSRLGVAAVACALLATVESAADTIDFTFQGSVSSVDDSNFQTLLHPGDAVSGHLTFDSSVFTGGPDKVQGGYAIPAGWVSAERVEGQGYGFTAEGNLTRYISFFFSSLSAGPAVTSDSLTSMVMGFYVQMLFNGQTAALTDYLSLQPNDFAIGLLGSSLTESGGGTIGFEVARLDLTSASFVALPDKGSTVGLIGSSMVLLFIFSPRVNRRAKDTSLELI